MKPKTFAVDIDGTITENGAGRINLDALSALRHMKNIGHNVIFVTGRSSVEAYLLSVFGGTTKIAVGENGGCITVDTNEHILLGDIQQCQQAFQIIKLLPCSSLWGRLGGGCRAFQSCSIEKPQAKSWRSVRGNCAAR